ncbi:hypothetical protein SAMD00019534_021500 [Acytostelium subglobosum LB1]|uniref:hypothetical protein n=1 Tax=Acytostelium subglobosum LB1 TaxID=1410327 RepID=UPI000645040B|nr:hypothetical protein SAMD00019534_021500 [Acytostelium subglobosum LB1]GAM18975.1 hypothetical protein SAMD00019534_021500 [Acytostelium subglobosum LB1]|eukprot:XP_012756902.1 hypothetical protein SAMD00019534_021500 [Acytostelium subglobosum LB1]
MLFQYSLSHRSGCSYFHSSLTYTYMLELSKASFMLLLSHVVVLLLLLDTDSGHRARQP